MLFLYSEPQFVFYFHFFSLLCCYYYRSGFCHRWGFTWKGNETCWVTCQHTSVHEGTWIKWVQSEVCRAIHVWWFGRERPWSRQCGWWNIDNLSLRILDVVSGWTHIIIPHSSSIMEKWGVWLMQTGLQTPKRMQFSVWGQKLANPDIALATWRSTTSQGILVLAKCFPGPHQEKIRE